MRNALVLLAALLPPALAQATWPTPAHATRRVVVREIADPHRAGAATLEAGDASRFPPMKGAIRVRVIDPGKPLRLILEFDAEPAAIARLRGHDASLALRRTDQLRADVAQMASSFSGGEAPRITREFSQVWSGAAVTVPRSFLDRVRALPYVRAVFRDDTVRSTLAQSVPLIRADRVQTELGGTGVGIRVGIIDTGIDYNHPAFGGGFGPGHRVAGGFDIVNNDADPMDDNGHGTHVAGIVGANGGGLLGVAPAVTLYAFKVLDASGTGYAGAVLEGLDRALDPDGNPATNDAMQVVNLSLGAFGGDADDPMSVALDNLTQAGVVCVAAAGNEYTLQSIDSPGTSRRAITVGASTKQDVMADFSSGGPTPSLDLKPDLVAPGVDIVSAALGGGTLSLSGTSMATPHVAGVAAALRQLHPSWTPDQVKAAIVGPSVDLGASPLRQGAGRVDAYAAATATFVVWPTHLAYGRIDGAAPTWSHTDTLHVSNLTAQARDVSFPATTTITPGAELTVTPSTVTLPPGGTVDVVAHITVDNAVTPYPQAFPYAYTGVLIASSGTEQHRAPISFHKAGTLAVSSSGYIEWLIVHDRQPGGFIYSNVAPSAPILMPPGTYDVLVSWYPYFRFAVRENVVVTDAVALNVDPAEATEHMTFANVGPDGTPQSCNAGAIELYDTRANWGFNYIGYPYTELWTSPASTFYHLDWLRSATNDRDYRIDFSGGLIGITSSQSFTNAAADLHHMTIGVPATTVAQVQPMITLWETAHAGSPGGWFGWGFGDFEAPPVTGPFSADLWFMTPPWEGHVYAGLSLDLYDWPMDFSQVQMGSLLRLDRGWPIEDYFATFFSTRWAPFGGQHMRLFEGMPVWRGEFRSYGTVMSLDAGPELYVRHLVTDMYGTMRVEPDGIYQVKRHNTVVVADTLRGTGDFTTTGTLDQELGSNSDFDFTTDRAFLVRGRPANLNVAAHMRFREVDRNPPSLRSLELFADGAATDSIDFSTAANPGIRFRFTDEANPNPGTVSVRQGVQGTWTPLTVQHVGNDDLASLPTTLSGLIAVRAVSQDATGNTLTLTWDPAFVAVPKVVTDAPPGPTPHLVLALAPGPNPLRSERLTVTFDLPSAAPAWLSLLDVAGREVVAREVGALGSGRHVVPLGGPGAEPSGIYFLRLSQSGHTLVRRVCLLR
jgi:hypothetical protein